MTRALGCCVVGLLAPACHAAPQDAARVEQEPGVAVAVVVESEPKSESESDRGPGVTGEIYADRLLDRSSIRAAPRDCVESEAGTSVCDCEAFERMLCSADRFPESAKREASGYTDCQASLLLQASGVSHWRPAEATVIVEQLADELALNSFNSSLAPQFGREALVPPRRLAAGHPGVVRLRLDADTLTIVREGASFSVRPLFETVDDGTVELVVELVEDFDVGSYYDDRLLVLAHDPQMGWTARDWKPEAASLGLRCPASDLDARPAQP